MRLVQYSSIGTNWVIFYLFCSATQCFSWQRSPTSRLKEKTPLTDWNTIVVWYFLCIVNRILHYNVCCNQRSVCVKLHVPVLFPILDIPPNLQSCPVLWRMSLTLFIQLKVLIQACLDENRVPLSIQWHGWHRFWFRSKIVSNVNPCPLMIPMFWFSVRWKFS